MASPLTPTGYDGEWMEGEGKGRRGRRGGRRGERRGGRGGEQREGRRGEGREGKEGRERRKGGYVQERFPVPLLLSVCVFTDETFPIDSEAIITTYPVSWLQCVDQVFLLYVKKVLFSASFSPPSPPTQDPQYNNRTAVVKSIKVRVLYSTTFQKELV